VTLIRSLGRRKSRYVVRVSSSSYSSWQLSLIATRTSKLFKKRYVERAAFLKTAELFVERAAFLKTAELFVERAAFLKRIFYD